MPPEPKRVRQEVAPGVWLDAARALYFKEHGTLVLADLHWGYARSFRARGHLYPHWGDAQLRAALLELLEAYTPARMIWLGDALHDAAGREPAEEFLASLDPSLEQVVLSGNHDRGWPAVTADSCRLGRYVFHHGHQKFSEPRREGDIEVVGHFHPALSWGDGAGLRLKLPVLVQEPGRWIVPALSPWAAGTDWTPHLKGEDRVWLLSPRRIFSWRAG
ncbi:MAG: hypothetical protein PW734_07455 [Verrucomicrobium sp.]|nr:hypothetical protein [Verrucomicrobium sp.]